MPKHLANSLAFGLRGHHTSGNVHAGMRFAWSGQKPGWSLPNNSFKPKLLRSGNNMAEKACHVVASTTQFGSTQALGMHEAVAQIESIRAALVGEFYWRFSVDNGFDFHFENFVLSAHEVLSEDEAGINSAFVASYPPASCTANPDIIAKSAVVAACLGAVISEVEVLADSSLVLRFSNNVTIQLPTDTPVVDWHWAITEQGGDPYLGCLVACFAPGDVQGCIPNNSFKPRPLRGSA